jgi:hypothetical protein
MNAPPVAVTVGVAFAMVTFCVFDAIRKYANGSHYGAYRY